eukprot:TRINITY_DN11041_c0_g2_i1.p1 TRINITY_DN11041_c0_g2~~TRINITY_DN11041_c0_g2_i1.p1  ORF type:complete len:522 (-),score=93.23 TRINITY_DN11041_c0_g2_i1:276-1841(-)
MDRSERSEFVPLLTGAAGSRGKGTYSAIAQAPATRLRRSADVTAQIKRLARKASKRKGEKDVQRGWSSFFISMLRPHSHRWHACIFRGVITALILLNMVAFIFESDANIERQHKAGFKTFEGVSSMTFLAEFVLRVWFSPARRRFKSIDPWEARFRCMCSFESLIDVLSFLPWIIECTLVVDLPNFSALRVLRLFRLLKSQPVVGSFDIVHRVLFFNAEILGLALTICAIMILVMATLLYYLRPADNEDFSSILATMYLAVMMLTGQGQPDGELPWYTKLVVIMTSIFAVAQFAIPASMLTWGFEQEAQRRIVKRHEAAKKQAASILSGEMAPLSSSSSDEEKDRQQEWRDYEKVVVGSDSESDTDKHKKGEASVTLSSLTLKEQTRAARIFAAIDADGNNVVSTKELAGASGVEQTAGLMARLDPDGDGKTVIEDFMLWLDQVKGQFSQNVFFVVLEELEARSRRSGLPAAGTTLHGTLPQQLRDFAVQFEVLQEENESLRLTNAKLEDELRRLKGETRP